VVVIGLFEGVSKSVGELVIAKQVLKWCSEVIRGRYDSARRRGIESLIQAPHRVKSAETAYQRLTLAHDGENPNYRLII
jgi:hypothetical protein